MYFKYVLEPSPPTDVSLTLEEYGILVTFIIPQLGATVFVGEAYFWNETKIYNSTTNQVLMSDIVLRESYTIAAFIKDSFGINSEAVLKDINGKCLFF